MIFSTSSTKRYRKVTSFTCPSGSLYALALSLDGQVLAAGGTGGLTLWNIETRKELPVVKYLESRGTVSCALWMKTKNAISETLCYGTAMGYVVFLRSNPIDRVHQEVCARRLGSGFEITCIAWDTLNDTNRIAIGSRDNIVQVFSLTATSQLQSVFAGRLDNTVPKAIAFGDHGILYVFGLFDGKVIKMNSKDGAVLSEQRCQSVIGSASVYLRKGLFVIDNATDGFTLYRLETVEPLRMYMTDPPSVPIAKQVAFGEDWKVVIGGGDNGYVYVFDRRTGEARDMLRHSSTTLVQTIATRDIDGRCIIACASPVVGHRKAAVSIWSYTYNGPVSRTAGPMRPLKMLIRAVLLLILTGVFFMLLSQGDGYRIIPVNWRDTLEPVFFYVGKFAPSACADDVKDMREHIDGLRDDVDELREFGYQLLARIGRYDSKEARQGRGGDRRGKLDGGETTPVIYL